MESNRSKTSQSSRTSQTSDRITTKIEDFEIGILRIEIDGGWSTYEFSSLLTNLRDAYLDINMIIFFSRQVESEYNSIDRSRTISAGTRYFSDVWESETRKELEYIDSEIGRLKLSNTSTKLSLDLLKSIAQGYTTDLYINSIEYSSPGWIEVIGNLNPLKILADVITSWRRENTERKKAELDGEKAAREASVEEERVRSQERIEMAKIKSDLLKTLVATGAPLRRVSNGAELERVLAIIDKQAGETVADISKDRRIGEVKVLTAGASQSSSSSPAPDAASPPAPARADSSSGSNQGTMIAE
ncbi:MAG TPA: hypothetical protein VJ464_13455 [Blastocatellia bacterium]|nr:hypothetical protein [Blastocatellia bacterium]